MDRNYITHSLDSRSALPSEAHAISHSLDMLTSAIVGALISERLIDYAGQPGQSIELAAHIIAKTLVSGLDQVDTVELKRFWDRDQKVTK